MKCLWIQLLVLSLFILFFQSHVQGTHETIMLRWTTNINIGINYIWAKVRDSKTRLKCYVIKNMFYQIVKGVKLQCSKASDKINGWVAHAYFIIEGEWGIRYCVSSLLTSWRLWWIIQQPSSCCESIILYCEKDEGY